MKAGILLFHSLLVGGQILGDFLLGLIGVTGTADTVPFLHIPMNVGRMSGASALTL